MPCFVVVQWRLNRWAPDPEGLFVVMRNASKNSGLCWEVQDCAFCSGAAGTQQTGCESTPMCCAPRERDAKLV